MRHTSLRSEIKDAILNPHKTHMWGVKLPTPQTAGTSHQIDTYASIQADEFIINFLNKINEDIFR